MWTAAQGVYSIAHVTNCLFPSHHRDRYPEHLSSVRLERSYDTSEGRPMDRMHKLLWFISYHVFNVFHLSVNFLCLVLLYRYLSLWKKRPQQKSVIKESKYLKMTFKHFNFSLSIFVSLSLFSLSWSVSLKAKKSEKKTFFFRFKAKKKSALKFSSFLGLKWHSPIGAMPFHRAQPPPTTPSNGYARIQNIMHRAV